MSQVTLDSTILATLLKHASSAAHIVGHSDALAAGPLGSHVDAIVHDLSELLGTPAEERFIDVEGEVSNLRCLLARSSALVHATESGIERARNVSTTLRQWLGEFYVAFEPASSSSVSWLLGDGCSVAAAR